MPPPTTITSCSTLTGARVPRGSTAPRRSGGRSERRREAGIDIGLAERESFVLELRGSDALAAEQHLDAHLPEGGPVRMAYVTPAHQYPLGVTMSLARRLAQSGTYKLEVLVDQGNTMGWALNVAPAVS